MAFRCEFCGKGRQAAHNVSHSNIKTRRFQRPNVQSVRCVVDGQVRHRRVCSRCIRSGVITKAA